MTEISMNLKKKKKNLDKLALALKKNLQRRKQAKNPK